MFSKRTRGVLLAGIALLALALGLAWRTWHSVQSVPGQAHRVAILAIDNQTGDRSLNWADGAIREGALLQLGQPSGQGDQATVFQARDAGDAAARQATHVVYGRLEPEWARPAGKSPAGKGPVAHPGWITYSFSLEEISRHAVVRRVRDSGPILKATAALALFVAPEAGVKTIRPAGVGNDPALEFFSTRKYAECTGADPQAFWCWERWATSTFEAGKKEDALSILSRAREQGTRLSAVARARLDLVEAFIRGDDDLRLAALERLAQADSTNPAALAELASALMAIRSFPQAEALYRTALQRNANQPETWNLMAYAQAGQAHFDEARKSLAEYERLAPASPNPPDSQGEIEWMAGDLTKAATWFLESYRRDAGFNGGVALEKAALSRYLAGDARGAEDLANKYLSDRDRAGDVLAAFHRARWQFLWGDIAGAERLLEYLVERGGPDAGIAASRLTLAALRDNDIPAAKKWARSVEKLTPKTGNPFLSRVTAALVEGDASAMSDRALRSDLVALRLTLRGEFAPAVAAWDASLRVPHGANDTFEREMQVWCLVRAGRNAEAASMVKAGWPVLDSDDRLLFDFLVYPNLLFVRAEAAATKGEAAEARRLYDLYLRYAGPSKDRFGQVDKARSASRL